jgi:hypothetical protein
MPPTITTLHDQLKARNVTAGNSIYCSGRVKYELDNVSLGQLTTESLCAAQTGVTTQTYQQAHESPGAAIVQANSGALVRRGARATVGRCPDS